jgi:hypothetical protein
MLGSNLECINKSYCCLDAFVDYFITRVIAFWLRPWGIDETNPLEDAMRQQREELEESGGAE